MLHVDTDPAFEAALNMPLDDRVKRLLLQRRSQLGCEHDLADVARFLIVQPNDDPEAVEEALGFSIFINQVDGSRFGEPDFAPSSEWIADHGSCYEVVFIFDDSGFSHVLIVERSKGMDTMLLQLCSAFALPSI